MKGNLEDLGLSDILHIVFLSKRTGRLTLNTEHGASMILFKNGRIVSAAVAHPAAPRLRDTILSMNMADEATLDELMAPGARRPLAVSLVQMGVPAEQVEAAMRACLLLGLRALLPVNKGAFSFDLTEQLPAEAMSGQAVLHRGIEPEEVTEEEGGYTPAMTMPFSVSSGEGQTRRVQVSAPAPAPEARREEEEEGEDEDWDVQIPMAAGGGPAAAIRGPEIPQPETDGACPIVLVEDDPAFRNRLEGLFTHQGFHVLAAETAPKALENCRRLREAGEAPAVIAGLLKDSRGLEVLQEVRLLDADAPLVFVSGRLDGELRHRAMRGGADQYFIKPELEAMKPAEREAELQRFAEDVYYAASRLIGRRMRAASPAPGGASRVHPPMPAPGEVTDATYSQAARSSESQLHAIRQLVAELQNPGETTEISLLILRLAAEFFDRAVLFLVKQDKVYGLGGFGDTGDKEHINDKVRRIQIDRGAEGVFKKVIDSRQTHRGKLKDTPANRMLIESLGKRIPTEVVVVPLASRRKTIALLYGDNAQKRQPIGDIEGLEIFMAQAGIAMENALLLRQLQAKG